MGQMTLTNIRLGTSLPFACSWQSSGATFVKFTATHLKFGPQKSTSVIGLAVRLSDGQRGYLA
jgi:hypothetical protein